MSLTMLSAYAAISVRRLRDYLCDAFRPLPCFRVGGKILVRRSEFDTWMAQHRVKAASAADLNSVVDDLVGQFV